MASIPHRINIRRLSRNNRNHNVAIDHHHDNRLQQQQEESNHYKGKNQDTKFKSSDVKNAAHNMQIHLQSNSGTPAGGIVPFITDLDCDNGEIESNDQSYSDNTSPISTTDHNSSKLRNNNRRGTNVLSEGADNINE